MASELLCHTPICTFKVAFLVLVSATVFCNEVRKSPWIIIVDPVILCFLSRAEFVYFSFKEGHSQAGG